MSPKKDSIALTSLKFSGIFESELVLELMLRFWNHPFANDRDFREMLLETAVEALRASVGGSMLFEKLSPENVNLVAAIWYAEASFITEPDSSELQYLEMRKAWLQQVQRALPSCFCNPDSLL